MALGKSCDCGPTFPVANVRLVRSFFRTVLFFQTSQGVGGKITDTSVLSIVKTHGRFMLVARLFVCVCGFLEGFPHIFNTPFSTGFRFTSKHGRESVGRPLFQANRDKSLSSAIPPREWSVIFRFSSFRWMDRRMAKSLALEGECEVDKGSKRGGRTKKEGFESAHSLTFLGLGDG